MGQAGCLLRWGVRLGTGRAAEAWLLEAPGVLPPPWLLVGDLPEGEALAGLSLLAEGPGVEEPAPSLLLGPLPLAF